MAQQNKTLSLQLEFVPNLSEKIEWNEEWIRERDEDLKVLEKDMSLVHELFVDIAALVADQTPIVENIESHMHSTAKNVLQGEKELKSAQKYNCP